MQRIGRDAQPIDTSTLQSWAHPTHDALEAETSSPVQMPNTSYLHFQVTQKPRDHTS